VDACCVEFEEIMLNQNEVLHSSLPWKSSDTISASSVGETDIQTPSVWAQSCSFDVDLNESDKPVVPGAFPEKDASMR
jgi:hypothetical protein